MDRLTGRNAENKEEGCLLSHNRRRKGNQEILMASAPTELIDCVRSGQVAFIRMATDPAWNYYASIYSPE